jgi:hypothetical protein
MNHTVFFSWQSDRSKKEGRYLIETALETAVKRISQDANIEEAVRESITVDRDTRGVPGSPRIFETILAKIDQASVFVADLTFCGTRCDNRPTPNPNVLIEYGWALKSLTEARVITVMNRAHGEARPESMPFDLLARRFPIDYNLPDGASDAERRAVRTKLSDELEFALRAVFDSDEFKATSPKEPGPDLFQPRAPLTDHARFRPDKTRIGVQWDLVRTTSTVSKEIFMSAGPAMWLRVMPEFNPQRVWSANELLDHARSSTHRLLPLIQTEIHYLREHDGFGVFCSGLSERAETGSLAFAFETGEVWSIDTLLLGIDTSKLYLEEIVKYYSKCLVDYGSFLRILDIQPPYTWICGLEGVENRQLQVVPPPGYTNIFSGRECLANTFTKTGVYDPSQSPKVSLRPFFELICRNCATPYPEYAPFV